MITFRKAKRPVCGAEPETYIRQDGKTIGAISKSYPTIEEWMVFIQGSGCVATCQSEPLARDYVRNLYAETSA